MPRSYEQNYQIIKYAASDHPAMFIGTNLDLQSALADLDSISGSPIGKEIDGHTVLQALTHLEAYEDIMGITGTAHDIARLLTEDNPEAHAIVGDKSVPSVKFGADGSVLNYCGDNTWIPSVILEDSSEWVATVHSAVYFRLGEMVFLNCRFTTETGGDQRTIPFIIKGLPFAGADGSEIYVGVTGYTFKGRVYGSEIYVNFTSGMPVYCSDFSGIVNIHGCYFLPEVAPVDSHRTYEQAYQVFNTAAVANIGLTGTDRSMEEIMVALNAVATGWVTSAEWFADCSYGYWLHVALHDNSSWYPHLNLPNGFRTRESGYAGATTIFNCYKVGNWIPIDVSADALVFTVYFARYIKVGDFVYFNARIGYPVNAGANYAAISGPPFVCTSEYHGQCYANAEWIGFGIFSVIINAGGSVNFHLREFVDTEIVRWKYEQELTNAHLSNPPIGAIVTLSGCYRSN